MKKRNLIVILLSLIFALSGIFLGACKIVPKNNDVQPEPDQETYAKITEDDFLTANGKYLYNAKGEMVSLRGVNLGGWLHMEGWMDGGGQDYTYGVDGGHFMNHFAVLTALGDRFTEEERERLLETYQNNYIQKSDLEYLRSLNLNYVRVPFFWTEIMDFDGNIRDNAFDQLDWVIKECKDLGMYVLLDLHGSVGGHSGGWLTGGHWNSNELWTNESYRLKTEQIWRAIAGRYKDEPAVMGYDLLNEPMAPVEPAELSEYNTNSLYDRFYHVVREVDDNHIIVPEAFVGFDDLKTPEENGWENVVYEVHFYDADDKENPAAQQGFINWIVSYLFEKREQYNVPVLFGEYNFWSAEDAWRTCMETLSANGFSWSSWTYKNTSTTKSDNWGYYYNPSVEQVDYVNDSFDTIARKWAAYATENYEKNEFLTEIIKECASKSYEDPGKEFEPTAMSMEAYKWDGTDTMYNMFDGNYNTRWANGELQNGDGNQYIAVYFDNPALLTGLTLYTPNGDRAENIDIYYKRKNEPWRKLAAAKCSIGRTVISFEETEISALKIVNKTTNDSNWWCIHELKFFEKAERAENNG